MSDNKISNEEFMNFLSSALQPEKKTFWQVTKSFIYSFLSSLVVVCIHAAFLWAAVLLLNLSWSFVPALSYWSAIGLVLLAQGANRLLRSGK